MEPNDREHLIELLKMEYGQLLHWYRLQLADGYPISTSLDQAIHRVSDIISRLETTDKGTTPATRCWEPSHAGYGDFGGRLTKIETLLKINDYKE